MARIRIVRTPIIAALLVAIAIIMSPAGASEAIAHGGKGHGATSHKGSSKHKGGRGHHAHRKFTLRGNPDVTRNVATALLAEKLPDLAALVGIQPAPHDEDSSPALTSVASLAQPAASRGIMKAPAKSVAPDTYQDSELDEAEDPDAITEDDYKNLDELPTDINSFYKEFTKYMASLNGEPTITDNGIDKVTVMETLVDWIGTRYLFGGMGRNGIDCSAYTGTIYRSVNFHLPRTAAAQWDVGIPVNREDLQFGDLIFFNTRRAVYVSHVGMYLGNGMFTHASSRNGVTISPLDSPYYSTHMIGARRYDLNAAFASNTAAADTSSHN